MASIILKDATGVLWALTVNNSGAPSTAVVSSGAVIPVVLSAPDSNNYQIGVDTSGNVLLNQTSALGVTAYGLLSFDNETFWKLTVTIGMSGPELLYTQLPGVNDWQLGVQWDKRWNNIAWSQPDGPYGKVYPQQVQANSDLFSTEPFTELSGTYVFGCGHSVDQILLQIDFDYESNQQSALILCPICSYCSRAIIPASLAYQPIINAILTP